MVMKRIRKGSGRGMQVITSHSRRIAKNVDMGAKVLEHDFSDKGGIRSGPTGADAFAGAGRDAREVAAQKSNDITSNLAQQFGVGKQGGGKITGVLGDGLGTGKNRVVPRAPTPAARMLEGKK